MSTDNKETPPITIYVEFCTACGLYNEFGILSSLLKKAIPNIEVIANPQPPRMSAFEVSTANGVLFYSKIDKKVLPNHPELVKTIQDYIANNKQSTNFSVPGQKPRQPFSKSTIILMYAAVFIIPLVIASIYTRNKQKKPDGIQNDIQHQRVRSFETINKLTL